MKQYIFQIFRKLAKVFSGSGLRDRFQLINSVYQSLNRGLAPNTAEIHGYFMHLDKDDSMGLSINGEYEPLETQLILETIKPGDVVLDIGANIGYYTLLFAKLVGSTGHVYAFEPDHYSYQILIKNINENNFTNITAFQFAVSNENSTLYLTRDQFNNLDHRVLRTPQKGDVVEIDVKKLDDFFPDVSNRNVNFIKMDIQGSENSALTGMKQLVRSWDNLSILSEFWPQGLEENGSSGLIYLQQLISLGFKLYDVGESNLATSPLSLDDFLQRYPTGYSGHTNILGRK